MRTREKDRANSAAWRAENPERARATARRSHRNLKLRTIELYGGKCVCCGVTAIDSLTIDHVHGGGRQEKRELGKYRSLWRIAREAFGTGKYQLLCMNCNHSKHANGGLCHHQGGHKEPLVSRAAHHNRKVKTEVILGLGGVCSCCGESELSFLTVDHLLNDGGAHRKERGSSGSIRDVRDSGLDKNRYQVLCFNCNTNKNASGGQQCTCATGRQLPPAPSRKLVEVSLVSPDGEIVEVVNLTSFCRTNGLSRQNIKSMMKGRQKSVSGWKLNQDKSPTKTAS